ncbi:hypothetical protein A0J61_03183 [Choanephora cucurbitarum]|uniref:Uncharacterized protein n=1 Tax=Choanephora cucurbitarum TaxID=101091 RepID=A0A1C7NI88_9FUNG|nr:hypothetical protein A0J61_03183 [Choanephora cucurbitarum]
MIMSPFSSRSKKQPPPFLSCTCACHFESSSSSSSTSSSIIKSPTRWFPRIRRRSSSSFFFSDFSSNSSRRDSNDDNGDIDNDKQLDDFEALYKLALDEMDYAIEFQGSIYYNGDLITATEAVDSCLERYKALIHTLPSDRSRQFREKWTDVLFDLRSRLDSLPFVSDN